MNNADLIVRCLHRAGIRHGFGIPSGNVLPLMEAMRVGGIDFVLTAHEGSAGFAADVTGRQTGVPGLAIATLGPGATNLATGVGDAYLDRSPMLALTCNINTDQLGRRIQMSIDHHALFAPISKGSFALRPGSIAKTLGEAIALSLSEPMGPVHLDLPEDVAVAEVSEPEEPIEGWLPSVTPLGHAGPEALAEAARRLAGAQRPVAVIGASAMRLGTLDVLTDFIEAHELPFATTTMAKGLVDERHPLSVGCIERGKRQLQRQFLADADLVVGVGYDTIEVEYEAWVGDRPVLQLDIEPVDVAASVDVVHEVVGDLGHTLRELAESGTQRNWARAVCATHRAEFQDALRPASTSFCPHQAIDVVREALPDNGILAFDVGAHTHQIASQWFAYGPKQFLITNGWSSMGFGLPAAIAAKVAAPELPVVCVLGDGCFQMTCGELATAKRLGLGLPIVVLDDQWLGLIKVKQERRGLVHYGTELDVVAPPGPPAHYFGVPAYGATDPDALAAELAAAFARSGPTVIEALVDPTHYSETVFD